MKTPIVEKKLTAAARNRLPASDFADPKNRKYPEEDKSHARAAISRAEANASPAEKKKVIAKAHRKFPGMKLKESAQRVVNRLLAD